MSDASTGQNVRWVLWTPTGDVNWKSSLERLTDAELLYCLQHAIGATRRKRLEARARKRGLVVPEVTP